MGASKIIYTSFFRIELEIKSIIITMKMMPNKIIPTRDQFRELSAKIKGVPIPPAPITPKIEAERTLISNLYNVYDKKSGNTCGNTACHSI